MKIRNRSEISVIHGFIQEVYPTYGIILSQNERVFFDCHSLSIGHGEPVYDIRDKVSTQLSSCISEKLYKILLFMKLYCEFEN